MLESRMYRGEVAIAHLLSRDAEELLRGHQEFRIEATGVGPTPCMLTDYQPRHPEGAFIERLTIQMGDGSSYGLTTSEIRSITVLPSRRLTNALAYQQMCQMERAAGLLPA